MDMITAAIAAKMTGVPKPTPAEVGKVPLANANGGYTLTDLGPGISYEVVSELPSTGEAGVIYLVANGAQSGTNIYDEYIWTGSGYEKIGTTETPNNVLIIPNISFADADAEATAALAMQGVNAGQMVVGVRQTSASTYYYFLINNTAGAIAFAEFAPLVSHYSTRCYVYNTTSKKFEEIINGNIAMTADIPVTETMPVTPTPQELIDNYIPVQHPSGSNYLYVQKIKELPDPDDANYGYVPVSTANGWDAKSISSGEVDISSYLTFIQNIVTSAIISGSATVYSKNTSAAFTLLAGISAATNLYTKALPALVAGNFRLQILTVSNYNVSALGTFLEPDSKKFIKLFMNVSLAEDQQEPEGVAGYLVIHCEAISATDANA